MAWALDLDGVVWLGELAVPGAASAVARLQGVGEQVLFVTNNSRRTVTEVEERLASFGVESRGGVVTSGMAVAQLVEPGETVLGLCGLGTVEELEKVGVTVVSEGSADTVVVGLHEDFDYWGLTEGLRALDGGARLVATNDDVSYPAHDGIRPGAGSILAALVAASGAIPEVAGKPYWPMCDLVRRIAGPDGIVVGDRPDTDGRFARNLGWTFGLVFTGITADDGLPVDPRPDVASADLATLVEELLG
jgi:4-nitrophenyl phosphatase